MATITVIARIRRCYNTNNSCDGSLLMESLNLQKQRGGFTKHNIVCMYSSSNICDLRVLSLQLTGYWPGVLSFRFYWREIWTTYNPDVAAARPGNILLPDIPTIVFPSISFLLGQPARFIVIFAGIFVPGRRFVVTSRSASCRRGRPVSWHPVAIMLTCSTCVGARRGRGKSSRNIAQSL